jgi:hypothetical protein
MLSSQRPCRHARNLVEIAQIRDDHRTSPHDAPPADSHAGQDPDAKVEKCALADPDIAAAAACRSHTGVYDDAAIMLDDRPRQQAYAVANVGTLAQRGRGFY